MTGRALEAALDAMHGLAADALVTELRQHMARLAENDDPERDKSLPLYSIPPQFLDKVLKFLAQNGINAPRSSPKVDALARELADLDLDAEARATH